MPSVRLIPLSLFGVARILAGTLLVAGAASAGQLLGQVVEQGRPVAGAEVVLSRADGVILRQAVSDAEGRFRLSATPGSYRLGVFRDEYAPVKRDGIELGDGDRELIIEVTPAVFVDDQAIPDSGCD